MGYCQGCGNELPGNARFCQGCGRPVSAPYGGQYWSSYGNYPLVSSEREEERTRGLVAAIFWILGLAGVLGAIACFVISGWGMLGFGALYVVLGIGALVVALVFFMIGMAIYTKNEKMLKGF